MLRRKRETRQTASCYIFFVWSFASIQIEIEIREPSFHARYSDFSDGHVLLLPFCIHSIVKIKYICPTTASPVPYTTSASQLTAATRVYR